MTNHKTPSELQPGQRIRLISMSDDPDPISAGSHWNHRDRATTIRLVANRGRLGQRSSLDAVDSAG